MFVVRYFLSLPQFFSPSDSTIKLPQLIPIHTVLHRTRPPELPHSKTLQYFNNTTHAHPSSLLDLCTSILFWFIFDSQINQAYICLYVVPIFFKLHVKFQIYSVFSFFYSALWWVNIRLVHGTYVHAQREYSYQTHTHTLSLELSIVSCDH